MVSESVKCLFSKCPFSAEVKTHLIGKLFKIRSGKSDPVQFKQALQKKRSFKTGAFLLAKMGILQAIFLLWGIGLLREKFASKMGKFGS